MENKKQNPMIDQMLKLAEMADVLTKKQAKEFVTLLMEFAVKQKNELAQSFTDNTDNLTREVYKKIQDALFNISQKHTDALLEVRQLTNKQKKAHEDALTKIEILIKELKAMEKQDGIDGIDGKDGKDGKDGSPDTREQIVDKINSGKDKDVKIEAKQITGLPEFTREVVREVGTTFQTETPLKAGANITITKDASGANVITGSAGSGGTVGPGTINEIAYFDSTSTVASLPVATYPSLTELSYVKGVTSAIQTQLNNKQASDTQLTSLAGLSYTGNAGKFIRVNAGETDFELASIAGSGTVTSVAMTVPTGLTISGSPITTTGTLAVALDTGYVIPLQTTLDGKANTALSNLASVAINTSLISDTANTDDLGSSANTWRGGYFGTLVRAPMLYGGDMSSTYVGYTGGVMGGTATHAVLDFVDNNVRIGEFYTTSNSFNFFTDTSKTLNFYVNSDLSNAAIAVDTSRNITLLGNLILGTDNTYDIGASGATRPRTGYFGTSVVSPSFVGALTGNASTATALANTRTIGGVSFDGTANITVSTATAGFTVSGGNLTIDARNISTDTTTGTKIGTATTQKLGFYNATPIVQPTGDVITALQNLGLGASLTVAATTITSRTLWGQTYDGSANVTGSLTSVGDITGGASSMIIQAGTGASRTLTLKTTTGASAAQTNLTLNADQSSTFSGTVALGANSLTMTGSLAATGARVTKGWFTDIESTNMPTVGGVAILTSLTAPQFTTIELGHATDTTLSRVSAGVVAIEGKNILTTDGGTLTGNITLGENTSIDLDPAGSADGKYSGICITGTAGTTLAFGDLIYLAVADSRWELTDADATATAGTPLIGMCVLAAAGDGSATKILLQGQIRADAKFPALTVGAATYVGETAGAIQTSIPTGADNVIRVVGYALTADEIYFNPSQDHQITVA